MKSKKFFGGQNTPQNKKHNLPTKSSNLANNYNQDNAKEARALISFEQANTLGVLPLKIEEKEGKSSLLVASTKDLAQHVRQILQFSTGFSVEVITMEPQLLPQAIFNAYKHDHSELSRSAQILLTLPTVSDPRTEILTRYDQGVGDIAKFLTALIDYCIVERASDIHISPVANGSRIRIRKNGDLLEHEKVIGNKNTHVQLVNRLKVLASITNLQSNQPVDGAFLAGPSENPVRIRLSCLPSLYGDNIVLRLHQGAESLTLPELGYSNELLKQVLEYSQRSSGLFIFAGATGSGKTTAMYALIRELRNRSLSVQTIEDPIEQIIDGIVQTAIQAETGLNYAQCLKAVLRQDPDVIVVGELRDTESTQLIVQAALTGHLVLTTVHARSVTEVIQRFQHYSVDSMDLLAALQVIICQELAPYLCSKCKVIDLLGTRNTAIETSRTVGCAACDFSRYQGRVPINEYLLRTFSSPALSLSEVIQTGSLENLGIYETYKNSVIKLLKSGKIDWQSARNFL